MLETTKCMNYNRCVSLDSQLGKTYYFFFFFAVIDLPRLISRQILGDLSYGGLMIALSIIGLAPFIVPSTKEIEFKNFSICGYLLLALISIIIARRGYYFSTMIFFGMVLFILMNQFIGSEFFSKQFLGRYLDYLSIFLFLHAALTINDILWGKGYSSFPFSGVIHFSEAWIGYELSNLSFFLFFVAIICGLKKGTIIRYALITIAISYCYAALWAGSALVLTGFYLGMRNLYLKKVHRYLVVLIIFAGIILLTIFNFHFNAPGFTIRLKESVSAIFSIYDKNNYYGLWEYPTTHGLLTTIIYEGGLLGILWIGLFVKYLFSLIENRGYFLLISTIIFSYFFVYRYVHVLILLVLHLSLVMQSSQLGIFRSPQKKYIAEPSS